MPNTARYKRALPSPKANHALRKFRRPTPKTKGSARILRALAGFQPAVWDLYAHHDGYASFRHGHTTGGDCTFVNCITGISEYPLVANLKRRSEIIEAADIQRRIAQRSQITCSCNRACRPG